MQAMDLQQGMTLSCTHFAILAFDSKILRNVKREVAHAWSSFHASKLWLAFVDVRRVKSPRTPNLHCTIICSDEDVYVIGQFLGKLHVLRPSHF